MNDCILRVEYQDETHHFLRPLIGYEIKIHPDGMHEIILRPKKQDVESWAKITRCKDCKHCEKPSFLVQKYNPNVLKCTNRNAPCSNRLVWDKDFCRYAEPKED